MPPHIVSTPIVHAHGSTIGLPLSPHPLRSSRSLVPNTALDGLDKGLALEVWSDFILDWLAWQAARLPKLREQDAAELGAKLRAPGSGRPTVSAVIPTLNEAENLQYVLPRIPSIVDEIVLVDGRSTDGTPDVARQLCPDVRVIEEPRPGKGVALRSGFSAAKGDIIVMLDADGSNDPAEIPLFVGALLAGADFVKGSRFLQGAGTADMPMHRRLGNLGFVW